MKIKTISDSREAFNKYPHGNKLKETIKIKNCPCCSGYVTYYIGQTMDWTIGKLCKECTKKINKYEQKTATN